MGNAAVRAEDRMPLRESLDGMCELADMAASVYAIEDPEISRTIENGAARLMSPAFEQVMGSLRGVPLTERYERIQREANSLGVVEWECPSLERHLSALAASQQLDDEQS